MTTLTATYSLADNKLRLYPTTRLDPETYARVKAAGFAWAPKQDVFVAPMWTPDREDLLLELCGDIGDEDTTPGERAAQRAERYEDYRAHRATDAEAARTTVNAIARSIPFGQPILVGHHSEAHARRDQQRIWDGTATAVHCWHQTQYWADRAQAVIAHATYKDRPDVRARRIKGLEAALRKQQKRQKAAEFFLTRWQKDGHRPDHAKHLANYDHISQCFPLADYPRHPPASQYEGTLALWSALDAGIISPEQARDLAIPVHQRASADAQRWITHLTHRLTYERTLLEAQGGTVADQTRPEKGGACRCWVRQGWCEILKINKVSVTVADNWGNGSPDFLRTVPFDELTGILSKAEWDAMKAPHPRREENHP